jgi:DNA-binding NarL/FixJ family response regulator
LLLRSTLSLRGMEILTLIAKGRSNKEIARVLLIIKQAVQVQASNMLAKLNCNDRAVSEAFRRGIVDAGVGGRHLGWLS